MVSETGTFNTLHGHGSLFGEAATGGNEMPYTGADDPKLPDNVKALPEARREQWVEVWNSVHSRCKEAGGDDCEAAAFRQANGVVFDQKGIEQNTDTPMPDGSEKADAEAKMEHDDDMEDDDEKAVSRDGFSVYKSADGQWRWASVSSMAIKDREFEIVTEKAYDDAIQHASDVGEFGEIDLVHVDGTDVGKCDLMVRVGKKLIEGGTFDDTELARGAIKALQADPDHWGISIKFVYDPSKFDGTKYNGNIRIKKRTILPQEMAASYGTKLVAIGGEKPMQNELSEKAREALQLLNVPEEQIEALAEKQIEPEPHTVEKEADAEPEPETVEVEKSLWDRIKSVFSRPEAEKADEPDAETGGDGNEEAEPVEAQEEKAVDIEAMGQQVAELVIVSVVEAVSKNLTEKDRQIETLGEAVLMLSEQVKALRAPIEDQVERRLSELPPIVKAAPSVTATVDAPKPGTVLPQGTVAGKTFVDTLMTDVRKAVEGAVANQTKVQV